MVGRQGRNVMGLHVQFMENYKLICHSIGAVELKKGQRWNPKFMKEELLKSLKEYEIDVRQLYALTCDGRGKALKALQLLQQDLEEMSSEHFAEMEDSLEEAVAPKPLLSVVYSGSYIIELAARLFFTSIESDLNECRHIIQQIRQQDINHNFVPSLDSDSRWQSTFDMVASLKDFIENCEIVTEYRGKMNWLGLFMETHQPLEEWLELLQHQQQYIVGDFYRDWLVCEARLKQMSDNEYAMHLLEAVLEVKQNLLDNEAFNAALYFDPRFNHLDSPYFSEERRKQAVDHIMTIQDLMKTLEFDTRLISDDYDSQNNAKLIGRQEDPYNILEAEIPQIARNSTVEEIRLNIRQKLEKLASAPRLPYSSNILEYWQQMQIKDPEIHILMKVVLAVGIGQSVTVKRTCSALTTYLTKEKARLPKRAMDNMLLVKLNADVLDEVEA
uniref:HAT C-terminal dimerisation domain-containing protein n=1 Tax=Musca domestica TaxID=7370 RepID=A0A1I8NKP6_MUSDO